MSLRHFVLLSSSLAVISFTLFHVMYVKYRHVPVLPNDVPLRLSLRLIVEILRRVWFEKPCKSSAVVWSLEFIRESTGRGIC